MMDYLVFGLCHCIIESDPVPWILIRGPGLYILNKRESLTLLSQYLDLLVVTLV